MFPYNIIFFQTDKETIESFFEETIRSERSFEVMAEGLEGPPPSRRRRIESAEETLLPVLGGQPNGEVVCLFCMCEPCMVNPATLPDFVRGSAPPDPSNVVKRYRLYRKFWSYLRRLGLWDFGPYKAMKQRMGHRNPPRDIIPWCVKQMVRSRFPNPPELPYKDHRWSADVGV